MAFNLNNIAAFLFQRLETEPHLQPKSIPAIVSIASGVNQVLDLSIPVAQGRIESIKSLFIDNSNNPNPFSVTSYLSNQTITIPPYGQAYMPVIVAKQNPQFVFASAGTVNVPIQLVNISFPPLVWNSLSQAQILIVNTDAAPVVTRSAGSEGTDHSSAGAAQAANTLATIVANSARVCVEIQNQSDTQIQIVLNRAGADTVLLLEGTASNVQGQSWKSDEYKGEVVIKCAVAGKQVGAYEI